MLRKTRRRSEFNSLGDRSKYICIPKDIKEAGIHFIWEYQKGVPLHVPTNIGFLHHYRRGCEFGGETMGNCTNYPNQVDRTVHKYRQKLLENVKKVLFKLSYQCKLDYLLGS